MTAPWETSLPDSLQNNDDLAKIKKVVIQWSRLVAWSWTPILAFEKDKDKSKKEQEQLLKEFFNETLQQQGLNTLSYESYADKESKEQAEYLSGVIQSLFLGNNSEIPYLKENGVEVTLGQVLEELSGEEFVFTEFTEFTQMFTCKVIAEYTGKFTEIGERKYMATLAYPPRPALSEYTVTESQLSDWAKNENTEGNYLPPSLYIPIGGT